MSVSTLVQSADVDAYTLTAARFWATSAALLGLVGAVVGGLALARSVRVGRGGAIVSLGSGLVAMVGGVLNLAVADGGPGTGNGVVGGALALAMGLVAVALGGPALARSRRAESGG